MSMLAGVSTSTHALASLFDPLSIAVVGASADPSRIGGRPLAFLRDAGYQGTVYPVNPRYREIDGVPCLPDIASTGTPPDVALIALSGDAAIESLKAAGEVGVPFAILFGAGFAEAGNDDLQRRMDEVRQESGIRVLGPNSLGLVSTRSRAVMSFATSFEEPALLRAGTVSVLSQSGALGAFIAAAAQREGVGLRYWISTGNESDLHFAEMLSFLAEDEGTTSIACYLEGTNHGSDMEAALAAANANGKHVSVLKVGRSSVGRDAVRSHTAALAGSDRVYDAVFHRHHVTRVDSPRSLLDAASLTADRPTPTSNRACILTISGGVGAWMSDAFADAGVELPPLDRKVIERLGKRLPAFARTENPVDLTGQILNDPGLLADAIEILAAQPDLGAIVVALGLQQDLGSRFAEEIARAASDAARVDPSRILAVAWMECPEDAITILRQASVPVFTEFDRCVRTLGALLPPSRSAFPKAHLNADTDIPRGPILAPGAALDEAEAKRFLRAWGFDTPPGGVADSEERAVALAEQLGMPVVLKLLGTEISHKTERGLVRIGLEDKLAVRQAYRSVVAAGGNGSRVLVEKQVGGGVEVLLGLTHDATFGPTVVVASGGTLTELVEDQAVAVIPVDADEALALISSTRSSKLIDGFRGSVPLDVARVVRDIRRLSAIGAAHAGVMSSLDINPLAVTPQGTVVLDAVVTTFPEET